MLSLGIGSIPMCFVLYKNNIVASWLAIWGIIGYSLLFLGFLLELFGIEWSMYLLIIGGLWEIIFAVRLIFRLEKSLSFNKINKFRTNSVQRLILMV